MSGLEVKHLSIENLPDGYMEEFESLRSQLMNTIFKWAVGNRVLNENLSSLIVMCAMDHLAIMALHADIEMKQEKFLEYVKLLLDSAEQSSVSYLEQMRSVMKFQRKIKEGKS